MCCQQFSASSPPWSRCSQHGQSANDESSKAASPRRAGIVSSLILSAMVLNISGCQALSNWTSSEMPHRPTRPILESWQTGPLGGVMLNEDDTRALLIYITELEAGYAR